MTHRPRSPGPHAAAQEGTPLLVYTSVLDDPVFVEDLGRRAQDPSGRIQLQGGDFLYRVRLRAEPHDARALADLTDKFYNWLGHDLREATPDHPSWRGMIYEMALSQGYTRKVRSLRYLFNALRARYTADSYLYTENRCSNGGFEVMPGLDGRIFEDWGEITTGDGGYISNMGANWYEGTGAAALVAGTQMTTQVGKTIRAYPGKTYRWTFWSRGDGSNAGRYEARNTRDDTSIIPLTSTGNPTGTWAQIAVDVTAPSNCYGISIRFRCPPLNTKWAGFDDVWVREYEPTQFWTGWATADQSIARYGRRERQLDETVEHTQTAAEAARDRYLAEHSWPWPRADEAQVMRPVEGAVLDIIALGYHETLNWRFAEVTAVSDVATVINSLVTTYAQFFSVGEIEANTLANPLFDWTRAGRIIEQLRRLRDASSQHYQVDCDAQRRFNYRAMDPTQPDFYAAAGQLSDRIGGGPLPVRLLRPGIMRDLEFPAGPTQPDGWLTTAADTLVDDIERDPDAARAALRAANLTLYELHRHYGSEYPLTLEESAR